MKKTLLEQALLEGLSGNETRAAELIHEHMIARARAIHEAIRNDEEFDIDEVEFEDEYLSEVDLTDLTVEDDIDADAVELDATVEADDIEGEDLEADLVDADLEALDGIEEVEADDALVSEDALLQLQDQLADVLAQIEAIVGDAGADDIEDFGADDVIDADIEVVDVSDDESVETLEDDMRIEENEELDFTEEDFEDLAESVKILKPVKPAGKTAELVGGKEVKTNDKSPVAKPSTYKAGPHIKKDVPYTGNTLQRAPSSANLKGVGQNVARNQQKLKNVENDVDHTKGGVLVGEKKATVKVGTKSPSPSVK